MSRGVVVPAVGPRLQGGVAILTRGGQRASSEHLAAAYDIANWVSTDQSVQDSPSMSQGPIHETAMVPIKEDFDGYAPPTWVGPTVERLLGSLLPEHVIGLSSIVLTESANSVKMKMRRRGGRKFGPNQRLGFYCPVWRGEPPAIYLIVDNMLGRERPWLQFARDLTVGEVLYHEVGHHLSAKVGRIASNEEGSADAWRRKLWRAHVRKRYGFLRPMVPLIRLLYAVVLRMAQRSRRRRASAQ